MTNCLARPDRLGTMRCTACRVAWDADDVAACPRQAPPVTPLETPLRCASTDAADAMGFVFASGLAPDQFATNKR
jgi:hypothetical protein